ncbi:hypothetical protein JR316_0007763 [Psilocybe cubensis]|uniref:BTB domain-containing protein n=2 Tax=Psilocybe cubensis TaxID=181762 RepID=A0A8H8CIG3_PSICU|nr:hypothetical protein JR316_0007763 [Psilocybe cubensis]KAH9479177.1 hypothetical protein JR316_0007763 [Psilocybe cubensis]
MSLDPVKGHVSGSVVESLTESSSSKAGGNLILYSLYDWQNIPTIHLSAIGLPILPYKFEHGILIVKMMTRPRPGPPPFDHPDADVILRSSDLEPVDFRVFKLLLSLSSPFFSDIFTLPQPIPSNPSSFYSDEYQESSKGLPVIQMSEDKETLTLLLGLCFPISAHETPRISSLQEIQKVAEAAVKFEMDGIVRYLQRELVAPRFIESQPVRVFAIAYRYGWDAEAKKAARHTLRQPVDTPFVAELELISGATLFRLREYHRVCGEVASSRARLQPALSEFDDAWTWISCKMCPSAWKSRSVNFPEARKWWVDWIEDVAEALKLKPWGETVRNWDLRNKALDHAAGCPQCNLHAREDLEAFSQILAVEIERDISSVS